MLVGVIHFAQGPERISLRAGSMIRLQGLDTCLGGQGDALYHGFRSGFKSLRGLEDRELSLLVGRSTVAQEQLVHDVVEAGSQLVYGLASNDAESRRCTGHVLEGEDNLASAFIIVLSNSTFVRLQIFAELNLDILDVFIGPFNL